MIFKQTSMPVLVSSACTALLKAAEPRKSMICRHQVQASWQTELSTQQKMQVVMYWLLQLCGEAPGSVMG